MDIKTMALSAGFILAASVAAAQDDAVSLIAAGSLKAALGAVAESFSATTGTRVGQTYGPSGLMRQKIETGEPAHVFASANMSNPRMLAEQTRGGPVVLFARNRLCGLAQPGLQISTGTFLDVLLSGDTMVGTSTPGADPSGDYAWQLFEKAGAARDGAQQALAEKALKLTGGADSIPAPEGRNTYAWVMENGRADVFLTYCTNAVLAQREVPDLQIVQIPADLSVGADYGLIVLNDAPQTAWRFAFHILSPEGQAILADFGFDAPGFVSGG